MFSSFYPRRFRKPRIQDHVLTKEQIHQERLYKFPYHYLDLQVDEYQRVRSIPYILFLKYSISLGSLSKRSNILDAGCGDGRFIYELRSRGFIGDGVDYSRQAIAFARAFNPKSKFHIQDLAALKLSKKYDVIYCLETIEHIKPNEVSGVIKALINCLRPHGRIIVSVPSAIIPVNNKHYQHFNEEKLKSLFTEKVKIISIYGIHRSGIRRDIYRIMERIGLLLNLVLFYSAITANYLKFLHWFYQRFLLTGKTTECADLIITTEVLTEN